MWPSVLQLHRLRTCLLHPSLTSDYADVAHSCSVCQYFRSGVRVPMYTHTNGET